MWLYRIFVTLCVIKTAHFAVTPSPADSNKKTPSSTINDNNLNGVKDDDYYTPVSDWSDTFDWRLLKAVSSREKKNVLISPLSLKLALVMLYEGSAGTTEKQFQSIMQFPPEKKEIREKYKSILESLQIHSNENVLNIGTRLFLESSIKAMQPFSAIVKSSYETDVHPTNFSNVENASHTINNWVDTLTKGHIKDLVNADDLSEDVLLVVANAIYFKGLWLEKFPTNNTHYGGFYVSPTEIISVPYMSIIGKYFAAESKDLDAKILRIPYKGNQFALYIILPNSKGGLPELIHNINLPNLKRQLYLMENRTVDIVIPKFKFEFATSYSEILQEMGLTNIFSNTASFPGIARGVGSGKKFLFVNQIKQKAGIEVNEEGSEIYVATEVELGSKFGDADINFNATHPFLIFVEDRKTGTIIFAGKVENPLESIQLPSRFGEENENSQKPESQPQPQPKPESVQPASTSVCNGSTQQNYNPQAPAPEDNSYQRTNHYFEIELLKTFDNSRNFFISPASIKLTLAMLHEGAKGRTDNEIVRALRIKNYDQLQTLIRDLNANTDSTQVEAGNAAFISNTLPVKIQYKQNLERNYHADIKQVDFSNNVRASHIINNWVNDATHGLIPDIVSPEFFTSGSSLVLANALYFKGLWKKLFDEKSTSIKCFRHHKTDCIHARMMMTIDTFNYKAIDEELDAQALQLLYGDGKYAMLILLPNANQTVEGLTQDIQNHTFESIVRKLEPSEVFLNIPTFQISFNEDISNILQAVGIKEVFGDQADLSGIAEGEKLKVSQVLHKAIVEVNEKGTIAASSTGVNVVPLMGSSIPRFVADHPFLFFIYHVESNNILFEGRFNEPAEVYEEIFYKPPHIQNQAAAPAAHKTGPAVAPLSTDYLFNQQNYQSGSNRSIYFLQDTKTEMKH